ncbi:PDDEXK nuclease domain-containing protein [Undibacterium sp. Di26W]|uniref:PDDEXK nuclease domain-containing protein n=1 Tax=Undibacterium sp. Di26W TaxID=3413035 RepID=UPI003BF0C034
MSKIIKGQESDKDFAEVVRLIGEARQKADRAVNAQLIDLYWAVGEYVSKKIEANTWGKATVSSLADYIQLRQPGQRGFSAQNIWRMRQFYDAYCNTQKLSTLLRELSWSSHLHILSGSKLPEEREFYLRMAKKEGWSVREVSRQIDTQLFARVVTQAPKLSTVLRESQPQAEQAFKDSYFLEFLGLPKQQSEGDLHNSLLNNLGRFLTELGSDFCFVGSKFPVQVGGRDFELDLLFYHRGLNSLVAVELKITEFEPEHLGKLNFYLEALDRDHKKPHENPAIGVLLCASKDDEVVEYALSRSLSPAMIAEYQTQLPDKKLLQAKLHEFYLLNLAQEDGV